MSDLPWTHFHPPSKQLFEVEPCDRCGEEMLGPNSVSGYDGVDFYRHHGLKIVARLPDDGYYVEETGEVVCGPCYDKGAEHDTR